MNRMQANVVCWDSNVRITCRHATLIAIVVSLHLVQVVTLAQDVDSAAEPDTTIIVIRDPDYHRLFLSPTANMVDDGIAHAEIGGFIIPPENGGVNASVGGFFYDRVYAEAGVFSTGTGNSLFPLMIGIRGQVIKTSYLNIGIGYKYYDLDYDPVHWVYTVGTMNYTLVSINLGGGIFSSVQEVPLLHAMIGGTFNLFSDFKIIVDALVVNDNKLGFGWITTGFRYYNDNFSVEAGLLPTAVILTLSASLP